MRPNGVSTTAGVSQEWPMDMDTRAKRFVSNNDAQWSVNCFSVRFKWLCARGKTIGPGACVLCFYYAFRSVSRVVFKFSILCVLLEG